MQVLHIPAYYDEDMVEPSQRRMRTMVNCRQPTNLEPLRPWTKNSLSLSKKRKTSPLATIPQGTSWRQEPSPVSD